MDIETIIYIVFFIIFIVTRIYQGMKKAKENAPTVNPPEPAREYSQPKGEVTEKPTREISEEPKGGFDDVFGDLLKEIKKQQQKSLRPETVPAYKSQPKKAAFKKKTPVFSAAEERKLLEQEGVSAFQTAGDSGFSWQTEENAISAGYKKMMEGDLSYTAEAASFEFDPRRAFMLKTLLETKHF